MDTYFLNGFFIEYKLLKSEKIRVLRLLYYLDVNGIYDTPEFYQNLKFLKFLLPSSASFSGSSSSKSSVSFSEPYLVPPI